MNTCNLLDLKKLNHILNKYKPKLIIHLAAQSLVDETINKKKYYQNNILATKNLITTMKKHNLTNLIFSSTAAVYKYSGKILSENDTIKPKSTYAKTKLKCEKIIKDSKINSIILRFFNVCSSLKINNKIIGEFHNPETHLIPTIVYKNLLQKKFYIYGNNYKTQDGTCIRDYIHIKDICSAIDKSINYLFRNNKKFQIINIGSSSRNTNLETLQEIEKITKIKNIYTIEDRRKGDVDLLVCSNSKAKKLLNWQPKNSAIKKIIKDEILWVKHLIKNKQFRKFKNYL
ncbi:GDP-mannose 4,6-dehydratase [Candidatus Pelagibacter sp. Uisw_104]|uniref:GDP-mannose 4,6-dehydratase n=1 Tax=Candidatus Pelagibacter sp. Uisw_104 TaxID=3230983 RepID=UPI0039EB3379